MMNNPDLSTRLKLMGVDVASFGDFFADARQPQSKAVRQPVTDDLQVEIVRPKPSKHRKVDLTDGPVKSLTYHDPFSATYKKYIFTEDGQYLLGGMMIGDVGDFTKLVAITKKKVSLESEVNLIARGSSTCRLRNSSLGLPATGRKTATILMTTPRSAHVM